MATTTTNLGLTKPALSESADVGVINDNSDKIDVEAGKSRANLAATYSASSAYAVGDYCERGGNLYRCTTAIPSGGEAWNSGHWTQVAVTGEIPKVIDNLTSTSTVNALSANQGKVLAALLTPVTLEPTPGETQVSITYSACFKLGRLVVINARIKLTSSVSSNHYLLSGLPRAATNAPNGSSFGSINCECPEGSRRIYLNNTSTYCGFIANESIPASDYYYIHGCYISES